MRVLARGRHLRGTPLDLFGLSLSGSMAAAVGSGLRAKMRSSMGSPAWTGPPSARSAP